MIIWLNGPFGGGKTVTAYALHRRLPGSTVFDPEQTGYFLRRVQPAAMNPADFQDDPLWRTFNLKLLLRLSMVHEGPVIVPMTLTNPDYYHAIITSLREMDVRVDHYTLVADPATVYRRLHRRGEGRQSWAGRRVLPCLRAFDNPLFENRIPTDHLPVEVVARAIARKSGLRLSPPTLNPARRWLDSAAVTLRHIRWLPRG